MIRIVFEDFRIWVDKACYIIHTDIVANVLYDACQAVNAVCHVGLNLNTAERNLLEILGLRGSSIHRRSILNFSKCDFGDQSRSK